MFKSSKSSKFVLEELIDGFDWDNGIPPPLIEYCESINEPNSLLLDKEGDEATFDENKSWSSFNGSYLLLLSVFNILSSSASPPTSSKF